MIKGQLEQRLLVLVTLGLVAFGLVMVFSATSASAALGAGDPMTFLGKQGAYAFAGLVLLALASRFDYHRLRALAPILLLVALGLCVAVLAIAPPINGARRWFLLGPFSVQPSEVAKLALCVWVCAYLARKPTPRTLPQLMRPLGFVVGIFAVLIMLEPDLGTTIALGLMVAGILLVSAVAAAPVPARRHDRLRAGRCGHLSGAVPAGPLPQLPRPVADPQGTGFQTVQAIIGMGSGGITGEGLGHGIQKSSTCPRPTPT